MRWLVAWAALFILAPILGAEEEWKKDVQLMELKTATAEELRDWARRLQLPQEGSEAELRRRIAEKLGLEWDEAQKPERTVTIDSALSLQTFRLEAVGEDYIRISGRVNIVLTDVAENTSHRIQADTLLLNQSRSLLEARGNVVYTLTKGNQVETFRGEALVFHLQDWMGIFYGGASERDRTVGGTTLRFRFEGAEIRRSGEDVVILNEGLITSSIPRNPYYSIRATKIYILAPGEWGFVNAFLYIGRLPVFWFPLFFQPGDEMWFNPVVGIPDPQDRRGTYLQTTTYLFGRKKQEDSPFSFLQFTERDETTPRVIRGLYLVRDRQAPPAPPTPWTLKLIADLYTNLGFYGGLQGSLTEIGPLNSLDLLAGLAISRNVYPGAPWKPYLFQPSAEVWEQSVWNRSLLFGAEVPFRYRFETRARIQSWSLGWEYWSDPFLGEDFGQRSETFTPFALIGFGPKPTTASESKKSSLSWFTGGSLTPDASFLQPFVRSLSLSPVEFRLDFGLKNHPDFTTPDPSREWFHPSRFTAPNSRLNLSGQLFRLGGRAPSRARPALRSPFGPSTSPQPREGSSPDPGREGRSTPVLRPPPLLRPTRPPPPRTEAPTSEASLTYNWNFGWQTEGDYRFGPWQRPSDVDWQLRTARNQYSQAANTNLDVSLWDGFLRLTNSLSVSDRNRWTWLRHPALTTAEVNSLLTTDAQNQSTQLTTLLQVSLNPLGAVFALRQTNVAYALGARLYEKRFRSFDPATQTASFQEFLPEWDKDSVNTHEVRFSLPITPFEDAALLSVGVQGRSTLEPRPVDRNLSAVLSSRVGPVSNTLSAGIRGDEKEWTPDLIRWVFEWTPFEWRIANTLDYDLKRDRFNSETLTITGYGWVIRYFHTQTVPYFFNSVTKRWEAGFAGGGYTPGQTYFLPLEASVSYQLPSARWEFWEGWGRLELASSANATINLQQYTNANLTFAGSLQWRIRNYLEFVLSTSSTNRAFYRYIPGLAESLGLGLETVNPLEDIFLGFAFWDESLRRRSAFKLSRLSLSVVHLMPDWSLSFRLEGTPRLEGIPQQYVWSTNFSLLIQWRPINEIRNDLRVDEKGNITVKTQS